MADKLDFSKKNLHDHALLSPVITLLADGQKFEIIYKKKEKAIEMIPYLNAKSRADRIFQGKKLVYII